MTYRFSCRQACLQLVSLKYNKMLVSVKQPSYDVQTCRMNLGAHSYRTEDSQLYYWLFQNMQMESSYIFSCKFKTYDQELNSDYSGV